jgi:hypothetical protein
VFFPTQTSHETNKKKQFAKKIISSLEYLPHAFRDSHQWPVCLRMMPWPTYYEKKTMAKLFLTRQNSTIVLDLPIYLDCFFTGGKCAGWGYHVVRTNCSSSGEQIWNQVKKLWLFTALI